MMASIPGAPLPDTVPSDALLYVAKKSIGTASPSEGIGVGRCDLHTARSGRGRGAANQQHGGCSASAASSTLG